LVFEINLFCYGVLILKLIQLIDDQMMGTLSGVEFDVEGRRYKVIHSQ